MAETSNVADVSEPAPTSTVSVRNIAPTPDADEVVAIIAGVEALWPKPVVVVESAPSRRTSWRFSGRWWARPVPARRGRPFR